MYQKYGFTLIELLVVVLIIGILAAVALPQYEKVVFKSRAVEAVTYLRTLTTAQMEYYMTNGVYATDLDELPVSVPSQTKKFNFQCASAPERNFNTCYALGRGRNPTFEFYSPFSEGEVSGKMWCVATTPQHHKLCRSFGPLDTGNSESTGYYLIK